jgi:hypothetical protein
VVPDKIEQLEGSLLKIKAALINAIPGSYNNVYEYDVNSMYPSVMTKIMFPMKAGEFKILNELPATLEYGVYRVLIEESGDSSSNMLFRFNLENIYTHYDIQGARLLNLSMKLLQGNGPNALVYTKDKLEYGSRLFKPTVDYMFDLKQRNFPRCKAMLNSLWGALCEKNTFKMTIELNDNTVLPENIQIDKIYPIGKLTRIEYHYNKSEYETNYARIGPFVTSNARLFMLKTFKPYKENIVKIHTDGVYSTAQIPELKIGSGIGEWKIEKQGNVHILNKTKCTWNN